MAITKEYEVKINGSQSVRELKQEILDARTALKEMQGGTEEYNNAVRGLTEKELELIQIMKAQKGEGTALEGSYRAISEQMSALKKVYKELGDEATRNTMGQEINALNDQLKAMDYSQGNYQRNVGNYMGALKVLNAEYKNQREELKALKAAMESMEPSMEGYNEMFMRAAEITHNMSDQTERLKYASPDLGDQLSNINGIAGNLAAGYSAVNAAMTLFGEENEDIQKIMVKVQASMQLVQGLQGLDGLLKRTEGLSRALGLVKKSTVEATTATTAQTTATAEQAVATEGATVAQKGLNTAMKANPIGAVIVVVTALVGYFVMLKDEIARVIGGTEKMNTVFNQVKVIASGVGNVIRKMLVAPMEALVRIVQGDFRGAMQSITNNFNIINNYQEGAAKKEEELAKEVTKKKQEQYLKDKENYIKNEEAKHGSDWKYTKEGKNAYEAFFKIKLELYEKDSEEYRQAQRDMWAYDKDYQDRITKNRGTELSKRIAAEKEANKKILDNYNTLVLDYLKTDEQRALATAESRTKALYDMWELTIKKGEMTAEIEEMFKKAEKALKEKTKGDIAKPYIDSILNSLSELETRVKNKLDKINFDNEYEEIYAGLAVPEDYVKHITEVYGIQAASIKESLEVVRAQMKALKDIGAENSDAYKSLVEKEIELTNKSKSAEIESLKAISDAYKRYYDEKAEAAAKSNEKEIKAAREESARQQKEYSEKEANFRSYNGMEINYISLMQERWNTEDAIYDERKAVLEEQMRIYEEASQSVYLTAEARLEAEKNYSNAKMELDTLTADHNIEQIKRQEEAYREWMDFTQNSVNAIGTILNTVYDTWKTTVDAEVDAMNASEEEKERIRNEEYEKMKGLQYAMAMINALSSAVGAYNSMASIPYVGPALGAAAAAAALASGVAQCIAIKNTKVGDKSTASTKYAEVTPTQTDFSPTYTANVTGEQETQNLANAINNRPVKAYVVESEVSAKQEMAKQRNNNTTF